jgi:F0F1-type ATP synthase assembly protein I
MSGIAAIVSEITLTHAKTAVFVSAVSGVTGALLPADRKGKG